MQIRLITMNIFQMKHLGSFTETESAVGSSSDSAASIQTQKLQ